MILLESLTILLRKKFGCIWCENEVNNLLNTKKNKFLEEVPFPKEATFGEKTYFLHASGFAACQN